MRVAGQEAHDEALLRRPAPGAHGQHLLRRVDAGDLRAARAPAAARRGRCRCRRRGPGDPGCGRRNRRRPPPARWRSRSPIGPPNRRCRTCAPCRIGVDRVAVVVPALGRPRSTRTILHASAGATGAAGPAERAAGAPGAIEVRLVAVLRLGQLARPPAQRRTATGILEQRQDAVGELGRRGTRQNRRVVAQAPACGSAAAWRRSACRSGGTDRSSAACSCRAIAATPARRLPAGRPESPRLAARRRRCVTSPIPTACSLARRARDLIRLAAGQQQTRVRPARAARAPSPSNSRSSP